MRGAVKLDDDDCSVAAALRRAAMRPVEPERERESEPVLVPAQLRYEPLPWEQRWRLPAGLTESELEQGYRNSKRR